MKNKKIGDLSLGKIPRIVAIIDDFYPIGTICGLKDRGADLIEIRVDCLNSDYDEIIGFIKKIRDNISIPSIGTIRENDFNRQKRLEMYKTIIPYIDAVDIEIDADITTDVIACASTKTLIVSEHNFNKTPDINSLNSIVYTAGKLGADIIKIAAMANSRQDVLKLLRFTENCQEDIVTIAMGEIGKITRVIAPLFGSLFTYCFIGHEVAPGQLSLQKMVEEFSMFYPDFRENS
ncbi:MAG: type I 3-dehydroquinate dehydratase [Chitinispirillia bacterium]|jgi:3-dehydroquinate dehydratase-1